MVADDARQLKLKLGAGDHRRLDEYLESVRSLERQIAAHLAKIAADPSNPAVPHWRKEIAAFRLRLERHRGRR